MRSASITRKTGETDMVYQDGYGWYVVYCVTDFDEEATEEEKPVIVSERRTEAFEAVYADWEAAAPEFKVNEKVWAVVTFDEVIYETPETTAESEGESESETETETAAESESGTETAAESESESTAEAE